MTKQASGEKWFSFLAYNSQAHYGYGTDQEAERYCDILNRNRSINIYHATELPAEDCAGLNSGDDTDGFRIDEAITAQTEQDEARSKFE